MERTTKIELTENELDRLLKGAAAEGARQMAEELREKVAHLDRAARVEAGLITLRDICAIYDITENTVRNWGIEPIEYGGQMNLYRIGEIKAQLAE